MNKGKLRELVKETTHLTSMNSLNEARIKVAVAFNLFDIAGLLNAITVIQGIEKDLPRPLERYRVQLTDRILIHIRDLEGTQVADKILRALAIN